VYAAYFQLVTAAGGRTVPVPLNEAQGWVLDVAKIEQAITDRTTAIMLCHPNNPTGTLYDQATLTAICDIALARGISVIIDEVYRNMLYDTNIFYSPAMTQKYKSCVMRVMSFSKDFSLTGWRVGYLQADSARIASMVALHDSLINCAPVASQYAAIAALDNFDRVIRTNKLLYGANRREMAEALSHLSDYLEFTVPSGGYFFFPRLKQVQDSGVIARKLAMEAGVVVVPGEAFGPGGEGHIRLCFGRGRPVVREGMRRINSYLTGEVS
jgi:aminotransferase